MVEPIRVEVFVVAEGRRVAAIEAPGGAFSTEAAAPEQIDSEVQAATREVLGDPLPAYRLVGPNGEPWAVRDAAGGR